MFSNNEALALYTAFLLGILIVTGLTSGGMSSSSSNCNISHKQVNFLFDQVRWLKDKVILLERKLATSQSVLEEGEVVEIEQNTFQAKCEHCGYSFGSHDKFISGKGWVCPVATPAVLGKRQR